MGFMTMEYEFIFAGKRLDETTNEDDYFTYSVDGGNLIVVEKSSGEYIACNYFKRVINDGVC